MPERSTDEEDQIFGRIRSHRDLKTLSLIDVPVWDAAKWRGVAVMQLSHLAPPMLGLMFENPEAGGRIFDDWRKRFGQVDEAGELQVTIVTDLPGRPRSHYAVMFTTNLEARPVRSNTMFVVARSLIMEPNTNENLQLFLVGWEETGAFFLGAASTPIGGRSPDLQKNNVLLKRHLRIARYEDLEDHEIGFLGRTVTV